MDVATFEPIGPFLRRREVGEKSELFKLRIIDTQALLVAGKISAAAGAQSGTNREETAPSARFRRGLRVKWRRFHWQIS